MSRVNCSAWTKSSPSFDGELYSCGQIELFSLGKKLPGRDVSFRGVLQTLYVPVRPICENLGLSWGSQRNRIYRDEVLRDELRGYS